MKNSLLLKLLFAASTCFLLSCGPTDKKPSNTALIEGNWLMEMQLKKVVLPFEFELIKKDSSLQMNIFNAEELIELRDVQRKNDSLIIQFPVFESALYLKILSANKLEGEWVNYYKSDDYKIKVNATKSNAERFYQKINEEKKEAETLHKKYEVVFSPNKASSSKAIGLFKLVNKKVYGTFATETGDFRYLEGVLVKDSLFLSTFDGSHAFYFSAKVKDSSLEGVFYSGIHHEERWLGKANSNFQLRDPASLTSAVDSSKVTLALEGLEGDSVRLTDSSYAGKVKIIQIMGSWCPNCLDESIYFSQLYNRYQSKGLEVIAVAFERTKSKEKAIENLKRLQKSIGIDYTILLGSFTRERGAEDVFPILDKIMSYPTTLFLDKNDRIRKIHTGFYGPSTGKYYDNYKQETEALLQGLLEESN